MESEKVKEIKKALEENANYEYYNKLGYIDGYTCKTVAYADILTYINELESEIEILKIQNKNLEIAFDRLEAENERLNERLKQVLLSIDTVKEMNAMCNIDEQRKQAVKEFAEKLKNKIKTECNPYGKPTFDYDTSIAIMHYIDKLVKEMVGEEE